MKIDEKTVKRLIDKWFNRLLLSGLWDITIAIHNTVEEEADEDHRGDEAYVEITDGYDHVKLTLNAFRIPDGGLELTIAHEMTHLALRELEQLATAGAGKKLSRFVDAAVERATERLSRAMVAKR
jgi:hypothetical protein